jgi:hypothetical protein
MIVKDPAIGTLHAQVQEVHGRRVLTAVPGAVVTVNGAPVSQQDLQHGDQVQVGNHLMTYSERTMAPQVVPSG